MLGLFNFTLGIIFVVIALVFLKIARLNFQSKETEGAWSGLLAMLTAFIIGIYLVSWGIYGLANQDKLTEIAPLLPIPYPLGFYILAFLPLIVIYIGVYALKIQRHETTEPKPQSRIHPLDLELSRKVFHITLIAILVCYLFVGQLVSSAFFGYLASNWNIWGIAQNLAPPPELAGKALCIFMVVTIFLLLTITDMVRIFAPKYYPVNSVGNTYREKERGALGPHIHLVLGALFAIIFFTPPIAMAAIAMAALGDAAATIVGINLGRHRIKAKSKKTWEGCIGGCIVSFGSAFLCMIALIKPLDPAIIYISLVLCWIGTVIFFLIDYFTPPIPLTDNILNPICIGLTMTLAAFLMNGNFAIF